VPTFVHNYRIKGYKVNMVLGLKKCVMVFGVTIQALSNLSLKLQVYSK